jgi:hypothetical protein
MSEGEKTQPREKALHELLTHSLVDIYVGSENTHWVLHEKLLCHRSKFFSSIFYRKSATPHSNKAFGLPEEDDEPFRLFVGWLYSSQIPGPAKEADLTCLFDLYLMGEKWNVSALVKDALNTVRTFYRSTESYPSLRRVQYLYANTTLDSPMRQLLVGSIAHMLVTSGQGIPHHWDKALQKNGQLAVDIIRAMQGWRIGSHDIPDPREEPQSAEIEKVKVVEKLEQKQDGHAMQMEDGVNVGESNMEDVTGDADSESTLQDV